MGSSIPVAFDEKRHFTKGNKGHVILLVFLFVSCFCSITFEKEKEYGKVSEAPVLLVESKKGGSQGRCEET